MRRTVLAVLLALLALPAVASAAPVTIAPQADAVSAAGTTAIEVANSGRHALSGRARLVVGGRVVASRTVRLGRRSVTEVRFRLGAGALTALRAAGTQRATLVVRVARAGRRATTARRTLTLRAPSAAAPSPAPTTPPPAVPGPAAPATPATPATPTTPASWVGRLGGEGEFDDFAFTLAGGQLTLTRPPSVPVVCFTVGGGTSRSAASGELFAHAGPWAVGADGLVEAQGIAVNALVSSGARTITHKVTGLSASADRVTGTFGLSFFDSRYDVFTNTITMVNCSGSQSFEAIPG